MSSSKLSQSARFLLDDAPFLNSLSPELLAPLSEARLAFEKAPYADLAKTLLILEHKQPHDDNEEPTLECNKLPFAPRQRLLESTIELWIQTSGRESKGLRHIDDPKPPFQQMETLLQTLKIVDAHVHFQVPLIQALLWQCGHSRQRLEHVLDMKGEMRWKINGLDFPLLGKAFGDHFPLPLPMDAETKSLPMELAVEYNLSAAYPLRRDAQYGDGEILSECESERLEPWDAAMYGNERLLSYLILEKKKGSNNDKKRPRDELYDLDHYHDTEAGTVSFTLCVAASEGHLRICEWIIRHSPNGCPGEVSMRDGIWAAARGHHEDVLELILKCWDQKANTVVGERKRREAGGG